MLSAISVT